MEKSEEKKEWYLGYWSDKDVQDAVKDALRSYQKKFGNPPSEILVPPEQSELKPLDGFTYIVRTDPYVTINTFLLGVIDDETLEEVYLDVKAG